ncbi:YjbF family lipoprotein, partial [Escherichia coli]|nr:YjbF family lipoprotein [Escherichia coli]
RKRAYCLKIQPATGSFARNLIYSTKPSEDNHFRSATLSSTFSFAGLETLNIAGRNVLCNVWQEEVTSTRPEKQWQNTFWVDSATGQVRQSRQMLGAGVIPVEMTFLKPAP